MKATYGILALFLVLANASTVKLPMSYQEVDSKNLLIPTKKTLRGNDDVSKDLSNLPDHQSYIPFLPENVENPTKFIMGIINKGKNLSDHAFKQLEHHYQQDSEVSLQEVDMVLRSIEARKSQAIGVKCAIDEILNVTIVVKVLFSDIANCSIAAAKEPFQIVIDVKDATFQIIFDGYELLEHYMKCDAIPGFWERTKCYASLGSKLASYSKEASQSIITLTGAIKRIITLIPNTVSCSLLAKDNAVTDLKIILNNINVCLGIKKGKGRK